MGVRDGVVQVVPRLELQVAPGGSRPCPVWLDLYGLLRPFTARSGLPATGLHGAPMVAWLGQLALALVVQ